MKQQILLINIPLLIPTLMIFTTICNSGQVIGENYIKIETGKIYKLIQSLKSYPHLKPKYIPYYKEKYGITTSNWKFPVVRNLEKYLSPFSQCFVHITNFQNVEFQSQSTVPIVIRHQIPSKITSPNFLNKETLTWAPTEFNATRASINDYIIFHCPLSKYLVDRSFLSGMCSSIDKFKFSFNTRPWNCEVAVSLFPPLYVFEYFDDNKPFLDITLPIHLSIPPLWTIAPNFIYSLDTFYESNIFNIWILDELYEKTWSHRNPIQWKKKRFNAVTDERESIIHDTVDEVHVFSERVINVSQFLQTQHNILPLKDPYLHINCGSINQSGAALIEKLRKCERFATSEVFQLISSLVLWDHKADVESSEYNRLERLWNNTKLLPRFWKLYKNVQDEVRKYSGPEYYYRVFQSALLKLQERHSFEVLKKCNKVAVILPALTCNQIANNLSRNENLADVFVGKEVLYDRAFRVRISGSVSTDRIMRAKWVMGSGIWDFWSKIFEHRELFNEDKSSETQLKAPSMSGNISVVFTIILFEIVCSLVVFVVEVHAGAALIETLRGCKKFATSEVFQLISSLVMWDHKADVESSEYDRLERLWNNTKLLPRFWKLYKNVQDEVRKYSGPEYYYRVFQSALLKLQERHSFEVLKECNNVAVILPALTCNQIAKNLSKIENLADVFVGKEVLYDRAFRVRISGSVSTNRIMRAKWVMGSGIWDFWSQIFEHRELFNEDLETQLKAPSMSGNISVVFTIILFGIVCSLGIFVLEGHAGIYDFGRATTRLIKTFFIYFYSMILKLLDYRRFLACNYSGLSAHLYEATRARRL
ncbi:unnamed protein product [Orchesella dallaii]|uniref:Uncharacterized protein n=1 Tax=Orchesella dallaii TaxID=48710 RepID=A0ABP1REJ5_9HEXA